jgi:O-antigen/teichoic acid export membrane protein
MLYVAKGGFWLVIGKISILLISFATMFAFGKWVPKEIFGKYQYILSTIAIIGIFTLPGIDAALIRAVAKGKEGMISLCAITKMKWSLIGVFFSLAISSWYLLHGNSSLGICFLIASFFFPFPRIFNLFSCFWQGKKRFDIQNKYLIIINFFEALLFIPVLFLTDNLVLIILFFFSSRIIFRGIFFKITLQKIKNREKDKETVSFGKHLTLMQTITLFAGQVDKIIIWQFLGPISVAIYSFAQLSVQEIPWIIPVSTLSLPKLSQKNFIEIKDGVFKKFLKLFLLSIPLFLIFIILAPIGYKIVFPNYIEALPYAQVLAVSFIFLPFSLLNTSLTAAMKTKELYKIQFITPIIKILLFLILIPLYGIWGIITSILAVQLIGALLTLYLFKKAI